MNLENCSKLFESFRGETLYVGFSGGADSTAALLLAAQSGFRVIAVHFDHGLRGGESRREAEAARSFAAARGIEFRLCELGLTPGPNLEAAARAARLTVWKQLAADRPDVAVVLGHHADDRAETLLLRLLRGANASGLAALREVSRVEGVTFLRPLLRVRRREIEEFLHEQGIGEWAEDSSNADESLTRNAIRRRILPALRGLTRGGGTGILHSLDAIEDDAAFLEAEAERRFREASPKERASFAFWRGQPPAMRIRLLRLFVAAETGRDFIPGRALFERFDALLAAPSPEARRLPLDAGRTLLLRGETLTLRKTEQGNSNPAAWNWGTEPEIRWNGFLLRAEAIPSPVPGTADSALFDADALPPELLIDRRRNGDRIIPFGETTPRPLKKLRTDRGIPADDPRPVLRGPAGELYWAPGIRHSDLARITAATERIVLLTLHATDPELRDGRCGIPAAEPASASNRAE